ncbi:hypothetical protein OG792_09435 [Micromonospora sp. NBC_01699]|uniref:hypothetical protein n=1 Tax=Micromonospora sp. NBC_01699 TaxID=2975984 RepID=UPI002E30EC4F|nr:hypothetical protein [Micromonospora sp. NBC_01699]
MTAAHAHEYEVPEHAPAPVEAVDRAVDGQVVYLTRAGQRVAAVVPPEQAADRQAVDAVVQVVTDLIRLDPQRARITILTLLRSVPAPSTATQQEIREELIDFLDDIDSAPRMREVLERVRSGRAETVPMEQVEAGLDL